MIEFPAPKEWVDLLTDHDGRVMPSDGPPTAEFTVAGQKIKYTMWGLSTREASPERLFDALIQDIWRVTQPFRLSAQSERGRPQHIFWWRRRPAFKLYDGKLELTARFAIHGGDFLRIDGLKPEGEECKDLGSVRPYFPQPIGIQLARAAS